MQTIELYGYIGDTEDGVTDRTFSDDMRAVESGESLRVLVNSGGGSVFQGLTIYQELVSHDGPVTVEVRGVAASIASVIAMAGDSMEMHQSSRFMIHNAMGPSALAFGNSSDLREAATDTLKTADLLDSISAGAADIYAARTGAPRAEITEMMNQETWLTAADSLRMGFTQSVIASKQLVAKLRTIATPRTDQITSSEELEAVAALCRQLTIRVPIKADPAALRLARAKLAHLAD
jgi:ATP-dependent Clp protease protease subunit